MRNKMYLIIVFIGLLCVGAAILYGVYSAAKDVLCLSKGGAIQRTLFTHRCVKFITLTYDNKTGRYYEQLPPPTRKEIEDSIKSIGLEKNNVPNTVDRAITY